ncbi:hypothetical protein ASA_2127 [Aeromonas salmonicida subsp. salmonicida A449]|uniref:Uncharacterized protein n=1 Tax=Aeromonas salmonicida (strain A449) TaxID=382245 RepID=A4SMS0_AERS4|nr:hypothetical protein ASA_2127 [Aeromonas salmonicida subsp. salmonicida A449]
MAWGSRRRGAGRRSDGDRKRTVRQQAGWITKGGWGKSARLDYSRCPYRFFAEFIDGVKLREESCQNQQSIDS